MRSKLQRGKLAIQHRLPYLRASPSACSIPTHNQFTTGHDNLWSRRVAVQVLRYLVEKSLERGSRVGASEEHLPLLYLVSTAALRQQ